MPSRFRLAPPGSDGQAERIPHRYEVHPGEWAELIQRNTQPGDVVCDSMAGSGTLAIAAIRMGRPCVVVERERGDLPKQLIERLKMVSHALATTTARLNNFSCQQPHA
jgi:hypothetical protein